MAGWTPEAYDAYLAAFIDTDGSIGYSRNGKAARTYRLRVSLYNNHREVLEFLQAEFGGTIHTRSPGPGRMAKQDQHTLVWQARASERVLRRVARFMYVKREQAELALEIRNKTNEVGFDGHADRTWEADYAERMRELNSRLRGVVLGKVGAS